MNKLEQLKQHSIIVADTGDFQSIEKFKPQDCTTNPSLIYKAAQMAEYQEIVAKAVADAKQNNKNSASLIDDVIDYLAVNFGKELCGIVPGFVSTEVDAKLSFNTQKTVERAEKIIQLYNNYGIDKERILIKIAAGWEGIEAARQLEKKGIKCNLTLVFSNVQAAACAEAGVTLISPFVGRILDWYKVKNNLDYIASEDPGVLSVKEIYAYYKKFDYNTIVMAASFRSAAEIEELCGIDRLTISPNLLDELMSDNGKITTSIEDNVNMDSLSKLPLDEASFRWQFNENAMATEKFAEGIRLFNLDTNMLITRIKDML